MEVREGHHGAIFLEHTLVENVGPYFYLLANQVIDDGLLITSLFSIVFIESSGDVGVIVLLATFLVSATLVQTPCCLSNGVAR